MRFPRSSPPSRRSGTFWGELSRPTRHAVCLAVFLVVALAFYSPSVFEGKSILGTDAVNSTANAEVTRQYHEKTGEWVRWVPTVFGGMPYINQKKTVPQLDTVVSAVRPHVWPVGHLFLLMGGVYFLVVYLTRNHLSGLLSGIAFGFTTYLPIIIGVGHNTKFIALAYAPFVLLAFVYTLRNPSLLGSLLFAGALALQLRANHPQMVYYTGMVVALWWGVEMIGAVREGRTVPLAKSTGWLAVGTGLSLLMVAQPYLSTFEYKEFSVRGGGGPGAGGEGGGMGWTDAMRWSQGPGELFTLVVAEAFGGGGQSYWGPKTFTEGPHYVGGVVTALAGVAVWRDRSWTTGGLGLAVLVTTLFALGKHAAWVNWPMFQYVPFFDAFRAPETWLSLSALGLAVLAGVGVDYALRSGDEQSRRGRSKMDARSRSLLWAFGVVIGIVGIVFLAPNAVLDFEKPNEEARITQALLQQNPKISPQDPRVKKAVRKEMQNRKEERRAAFSSDALRTLFFLLIAAAALLLYRRETLPAWIAGFIVVGVVLIDLWGVDARYMGEDRYSSQDVEDAIATYDFDQFLNQKQEEAGGLGRFRVLSLAEGNPTSNARPSYHHESVGGYHGAKLQRYQDYLDHILQVNDPEGPNENALDLMNTRYIVARQQLPGTEVVYRSEGSGVVVLENPDAVPRGFLVGDIDVVRNAEETWDRLRNASFDPRQTAIVPEALDAPVPPVDSTRSGEVQLEHYAPEEIRWTVRTAAPRLFVASEVYYPAGWNAYLDGEKVPIRRVNYLLRGVHVPEGEHTLVMRFEPKSERYGTWIAAGSTALVYGGILALLGLRVRRRRRSSNTGRDESGS